MAVKVSHATVGAFQENSYLLVDEATSQAVFVDPGADDPRLLQMLVDSGAALQAIWLTHAHVDHIGGVAMLKRAYDVPVYLHPADRPVYDAQEFFAEAYQIPFEVPPPPDRELAEGDVLTLGETSFTVMHVPGHSPGHVFLCSTAIALGGDLLFAGSIGRTDLPLASPAQMNQSLKRMHALPPALIVYPGHGPSTTIGTELRTNPFLNGTANVKSHSA